jgi:STE24 endopeptidase
MLTTLAAIAPAFDVEAASRAYLDTLSGAARAKSDAYFEGGYWIILWDAVVGMLSYLVMLRFGWSARWRSWAERVVRFKFVQALIYSVPLVIVGALLTLPWGIYTGFLREKQYGLMNQSFAGWLGEQGIMLGVDIVTTSLLIAVLFAVIRRWPRRWWIGATGAVVAMLLLIVMITPVFISPLLNKYTPMAAGPMRDGILTMAHAQGIPADNVYVFDASKQTKRVSANVSGLGPTIRISLNDNLLNRSTPEGIKSVMGHEMGHYVLNHIEWMIAQFAVMIGAMMFVLWWSVPKVIERFGGRWGVSGPADLAAVPVYFLIVTLLLLAATPITHTLIRRHEIQADIFGLDAAREPDGFAQTAMQLSEYRKIEPGPIEEALFFDHPSGSNRVHRAMAWKAAHLAELPEAQRGMVRPLPASASSIPASASPAPAAASNVQR